jgi:CheY-like chemotaxis protein
MHDPRKPRALKPRTLSVLVADANTFSRSLIGEILRNLNVGSISSARSAETAYEFLRDRPIDAILVSCEEGDGFDGLGFIRTLRKSPEDRMRRLPAILVTTGLTRQTVIAGRDAGFDEFLAKPISPVALRQRLEMVIETPRPFIDCTAFLGPCRRRKNPADYYGARRRSGEQSAERPPLVDQDEIAAQSPIRIALSQLRESCALLRGGQTGAFAPALGHINAAKSLAVEAHDHAFHACLASFEAYIGVATPLGQLEEPVINDALNALEQLCMLPLNYAEARDSVATALGKAIQKKLAA